MEEPLLNYIDKRFIEDPTGGMRSLRRILGTDTTIPDDSLPVEAEASLWKTVTGGVDGGERLIRAYEFQEFKMLKYFLDELLIFQEEIQHHSTITVDHMSVTVETYTRDLNTVSYQDIKLTKFCDEIYGDTRYFMEEDNEEF